MSLSSRVLLVWALFCTLFVVSAAAYDPRHAAVIQRQETPSSGSQSSTTTTTSVFSVTSKSTTTTSTSKSTTTTTSTSSSESTTSTSTTSSESTSVPTTASSTTRSSASVPPPLTVAPDKSKSTPAHVENTGFPNKIATTQEDEPSSTPEGDVKDPVNAASTSFWANKGAVAGTFVTVSLVIVGLLVAVAMVLRKRAANCNSARDTFYDKPTPPERFNSPEPSMRSLGNEPMDAQAMPVSNYGAVDHQQYLVDTTDYAASYPPTAAYAQPAAPAAAGQHYDQQYADQYYNNAPNDQHHSADQHYATDQANAAHHGQYVEPDNAYESYNQYYADPGPAAAAPGAGYAVSPPDRQPSLSPHPFSHPSHNSTAPPAMRDIMGRDSYQQSIDSFYGAAGTAR